MRACVFLTRTPQEGETVVVLPPKQADLFEYAGDIWANSVEDALGMLAKGRTRLLARAASAPGAVPWEG